MKGIEPSVPTWKDGVLPLHHIRLERLGGIEPPPQPWQGYVMPLDHSRISFVGEEGVEPSNTET
jgi:hypothetical protein